MASTVRTGSLVLLVLACLSYGLWWPAAPVLDGHSAQYLEVASDLQDFQLDQLHDRAPGYPVLLALTGSTATPTRLLLIVSLLLHAVSVWLLAKVLDAAAVRPRWIATFAVLLMLPPFVEPAGYVMTENLSEFTLAASCAGLVLYFVKRRIRWLVLATVACAYAGLTRPVYQPLALVLAACVLAPPVVRRARLFNRDRVVATVALVVGSVLVIGAVSWQNSVKFGYFGVSPLVGFHLSTKTMSFVERLPEPYAGVRAVLVRERDRELTRTGGTHTGTQTVWNARPELAKVTGLSTPELSSYLLEMNFTLIRNAPLEYLQEVARSMASYWFPAAGPLATMQLSILRWVWALLHVGLLTVFGVQLALAIGLTAFGASRRRSLSRTAAPGITTMPIQALAYVVCGAVVFYTMVLSCALDIGEPRQRRPTDILVVCMCWLAAEVWRRNRDGVRS